MKSQQNKVFVVGIGPGSNDLMTLKSQEVLKNCDVIVGYETYVNLIKHLLSDQQEVVSAGMTEEVLRAQIAVEKAVTGKSVCVVSSGDSGLYGMAGLIYEVVNKNIPENRVEVEVVPGITALSSAASLLGAPVMHDFCAISLSDHLTPWATIEERIHYAGAGDFVIALYNPKSSRRKDQIVIARDILLKYRQPDNPVGIVISAYRPEQKVILTTLQDMLQHPINMLTTIIIGNSTTSIIDNKMVTPRGYERKYQLGEKDQNLAKSQRMSRENEPWSLQGEKSEGSTDFKVNIPESLGHGLPVKYYIKTLGQIENIDSEKFLNLTHLAFLNPFLTKDSRIQTTSDGRLILVANKIPETAISELRNKGLFLYNEEKYIVIKKCNFCEGEKTESLPWLDKLEKILGAADVPGQLNIGYNGCGMSCHGAVMEDIGIVYFRGEFEVYIGGRHMGRYVRLPFYVHKNLSGDQMIETVLNMIERFKIEGFSGEKFFKFILRIQENEQ